MERHAFRAMGTDVEVMLEGPPTAESLLALASAEQEFHRLEAILTRFDPDSALSRLNAEGSIVFVGNLEVCVKLTTEAYARLSIVGKVRDDGATYVGPFGSRRHAELAAAAVYDAVPMRQCSRRLSTRRRSGTCMLADVGRCAAPCDLRIDVQEYDQRVAEPFRRLASDDPTAIVDALMSKMRRLAGVQRYEDAAEVRSRDRKRAEFLAALTDGDPNDPTGYDLLVNSGRLGPEACAELIAQAVRAKQLPDGPPPSKAGDGWDGGP